MSKTPTFTCANKDGRVAHNISPGGRAVCVKCWEDYESLSDGSGSYVGLFDWIVIPLRRLLGRR